jgi:hypothetical protein
MISTRSPRCANWPKWTEKWRRPWRIGSAGDRPLREKKRLMSLAGSHQAGSRPRQSKDCGHRAPGAAMRH